MGKPDQGRILLHLPSLDEILAARDRIGDRVLRTPLVRWPDAIDGAQVYLKPENLQPHGSFKLRAGANALLSLPPDRLAGGVVSGSAGNFGQGIAAAAQELGVKVTIFAPDTAARKKLDGLRALGAEIRIISFADWWQVLEQRGHPSASGLFVHPVAENSVIAGNATIGLEIAEDLPEVDCVVVPFGGGGLISGIGAALRAKRSAARLLAAECETATPLQAALQAGGPVNVNHEKSFVDGIGSGSVLPDMWPLVSKVTDQVITASLAGVRTTIRDMVNQTSLVAEGAGATALAAVRENGAGGARRIVCVVSGGNIDAEVLAEILSEESVKLNPA